VAGLGELLAAGAAVTGASELAGEFYSGPSGAEAWFLILIFGRPLPVFKGPQLLVTEESGQFTATDACDGSVFAGAKPTTTR